MTVWWGLVGLLGLLGCCGLLRSHRADGTAIEEDPLARYPVAREPATPNADAAHTPLMTPAITPEMLAARPGPVGQAGSRPDSAVAQPEAVVPESGSIAGEIPAPRPQSAVAGERPGVPEGAPVAASAGQAGGSVPVPAGAVSEVPPEAAQQPAEPRTSGVPQQPKHALRPEASAPGTGGVPRTREPEAEAPQQQPQQPRQYVQPQPDSGGLVGSVKRLLRRA
jgi:hypothetical protein